MTALDLRVILWNIHNTDNLIWFTFEAQTRIVKYADRWQPKWTKVFEQILEDMINGNGYQDKNNKNGRYWELPVNIDKKEWMVVFYRPPEQHNDAYLVYDFKIIPK